jgi:phosphoenolpyruvate synthase/pyruvate phosphate dikinase
MNAIYYFDIKNLMPPVNEVGNKAWSLFMAKQKGFKTPEGICLSKSLYLEFIESTGLDKYIITELARKSLEEMRWEEMWDAALRIRNQFLKAELPTQMADKIIKAINSQIPNKPLVIRSSSLAEDGSGSSFAGIHESFVNVIGKDEILKSIRLVWASLWSDGALLYRKEMGVSFDDSAMAVIIQELIDGEVSGIGFCQSPNNNYEAVIESIYGLNKGLVDGDIEPDRFVLNRQTGKLKDSHKSQHSKIVNTKKQGGVSIVKQPTKLSFSIDKAQVQYIYKKMMKLESLFDAPQDVEWTLKNNIFHLLQSRPITLLNDDEKKWNLSLKRSFDNLSQLAIRIEHEILPAMESEANQLNAVRIFELSNPELIEEIKKRQETFTRWNSIYWDECIPFAHGVRLFGVLYNDMVKPDDPFEFIKLLMPIKMESTTRNNKIAAAVDAMKKQDHTLNISNIDNNTELKHLIDLIGENIQPIMGEEKLNDKQIKDVIAKYVDGSYSMSSIKQNHQNKEQNFITAFNKNDQSFAEKVLKLAKKSYQLRDDDNIYLGKVYAALADSIKETNVRFKDRFHNIDLVKNAEEAIKALKFPNYEPEIKPETHAKNQAWKINVRQMRGQPASKGIARGNARVIQTNKDLLKVKKDEVLVCDSIDPNMTFVIPLVSAIVERRGGMLVHGAIIAREYGIACVTGIPDATAIIQTGDDVTVDGFYGLVTNHSRTLEP